MKLIIKNKLVSAGGSSTVVDEKGKEVLFVKGKAFSLSKKKWVRDLKKNKLFLVRNKIFHGIKRSCLIYDASKNLISTVVQSSIFKDGYDVNINYEKINIKPTGFAKPYEIIKDNQKIGSIAFLHANIKDAFELTISNKDDAPFLTAVVIAIDNIRDKLRKSK